MRSKQAKMPSKDIPNSYVERLSEQIGHDDVDTMDTSSIAESVYPNGLIHDELVRFQTTDSFCALIH